MKMAIDEFGKKIKGGGVGLFYYAGHGMEVNGRNYLIPLNANINNENEVEYESVDAGRVLAKMESAGNRVSIVMLDACRDNPFARNFRSASKGLAQTVAPEGSYIAYAAQPGAVASDGAGNNSVFTEEFVKTIRAEGVEINKAFRQVRSAVMQKTGSKQVPWTSESLTGDFYFKLPNGESESQKTVVEVPAVAPPAYNKKKVAKKEAVQVAQVEVNKLRIANANAKYISSFRGTANNDTFTVATDPSYAIDGNIFSSYSSGIAASQDRQQWWQADLGRDCHVLKLRILWHKLDISKDIEVIGSDNSNFAANSIILVPRQSIYANGNFSDFSVNANVRFVRLNYSGGGSSAHGLDLSEFEIYGE